MADLNYVFLEGNLVSEPYLKETVNGDMSVSFTLCTVRRTPPAKTGGQARYSKSYIHCTAFKQLAAYLSKYCNKGDKIRVIGRIESYTREQPDGTKKEVIVVHTVNVENLRYLAKSLQSQEDMAEIEGRRDMKGIDLSLDQPASNSAESEEESEYAAFASDELPF